MKSSGISLFGAITVGVGAIVGGGIMVLAGPAFAVTGPSLVVAILVNAVLAFMTAMSFAEMSSAFPESGGTYLFAQKVLSVRMAFVTGWVVWLAYIVAGVLYAMGFATYAVATASYAATSLGQSGPYFWESAAWVRGLALASTCVYSAALLRSSSGGGVFSTWSKVVLFAVLVIAGIWVIGTGSAPPISESFSPFFSGGTIGLLSAMGLTFIALQGFEIIATVAGEIDQPERTIPRAMFVSLGVAVAVYLPLLLVISIAGVAPGEHIATLAARSPDTLFAEAIQTYMGPAGYWLVLLTALAATLSALSANILAASRIAHRMARDRALPWVLGIENESGGPVSALYASALAMCALLFMMQDLGAAGAAASLIFLISFAFAHATAYLARRRGLERPETFRSPWFPVIPVVGGIGCAALALFQALAEAQAGVVVVVWLGVGALLYLSVFGRRAEVADAASAAGDHELSMLRGKDPVLLVPISNPKHAHAMAQVASVMLPPMAGKTWLLSIVPPHFESAKELARLADAQSALANALRTSVQVGRRPESLLTLGMDPWTEIRAVAAERGCGAVLLGLGDIESAASQRAVEDLSGDRLDVTVLRAPEGFEVESADVIVVPLRPDAGHDELRARLIGGLQRVCGATITYLVVVGEDSSDSALENARRHVEGICSDEVRGMRQTIAIRHANVSDAIAETAGEHGLVIIGLARLGRRQRAFGDFAINVARRHTGGLILIAGQ